MQHVLYAGRPRWKHCLGLYSLSCRGRVAATGIKFEIYAFNYICWPSPPQGMYVYLLTLAYLIFHICYFICRPLLMHRCLKSTKPAAHRSLTSRYVTVDRFLCTFVYTSQAQVTFNMYPWFGHVTCFICRSAKTNTLSRALFPLIQR